MTGDLVKESKTYKPFKYEWAVQFAIDGEDMHWHEKEANLEYDVAQWKGRDKNSLTTGEKDFITNILKLFTQLDVTVGQNYIEKFLPKFKNNEIRAMLSSNLAREFIHQRAYALLNDTLGLDEKQYSAFLEYSEMADQIDFILDSDIHTVKGLGLALAKAVFSEGVALFASFVMLLSFKRFGKMLGMCDIVEWSIKDENLHVDGMTALFRAYCDENPRIVTDDFKKDIYEMAAAVVKLEDEFIEMSYKLSPDAIKDLKKEDMKQYMRYLSDRRLTQLGLKPQYGIAKNPLPWVDEIINARVHGNFFETRITDYSVVGLAGSWE